jgi:type VI secretion system secreted protein Hcp
MKRNSLMGAMLVLVLIAIVFTPVVSIAAMRVFVNITGIPGESMDSGHMNWIDAIGYGDSILMPFSGGTGGGGATGRAEFAPIKIIKFLDKASVDLRDYLVNGRHIPDVKIEFWTDEAASKIIYKIELEEVIIGD